MEYIYITRDGELQHHGVKGMRWGVRKDRSNRVRRLSRRKAIKQMSDEELNRKINRLQKENQYKQLTDKHSAGKKIIAGVLVGSAVAVAKGYLTKYLKQGIEVGGPKLADAAIKVVGDLLIPNGKPIL